MNRLVIIGNGFDLAHGLPTRYEDFINWYWQYRISKLTEEQTNVSDDGLCSFTTREDLSWEYLFSCWGVVPKKMSVEQILSRINSQYHLCKISKSTFFKNICQSIENKKWVDIENEYYKLLIDFTLEKSYYDDAEKEKELQSLNNQLDHLRELLSIYLSELDTQELEKKDSIWNAIYAPINSADIASKEQKCMEDHVNFWLKQGPDALKKRQAIFEVNPEEYNRVIDDKGNAILLTFGEEDYPLLYRLPSRIMLLNFNYTSTPEIYLNKKVASIDYIHGKLDQPANMIFGYGDEIDDKFKQLKELNDEESLKNVKSIRYLEAPNYRDLLSFLDSEPYQVLIMGHSCGNSDRTLLNTIFEHDNCVSIKVYYYQKDDGTDDYIEKVQNISRNFNDMKLMRDRVVNKTQCEPLVK